MNCLKLSEMFAAILLLCFAPLALGDYKIGVGRADVTGPAAEIIFMGYAKIGQKGCGLHLRQFSRAYIVDDGTTRVVYVTTDACMMNHGIKREVVKKLKAKFGDTYSTQNVILSGTHTHGAPGGFLEDMMLDISELGFVQQTFNALVDGIFTAICRAHENMVDGKIYFNRGELENANINRSPASYLMNPEEERAKYKYNTDKDMVQLKFVNLEGKPIGVINWYAVHPTSMNNTNCLITSDNVGYASILLEESINGDVFPGQGDFVGAFASTNLGDVSPNLKGPICVNTGEPCDFVSSTCNGENKYCIAFGPGEDMFDSTKIIANRLLSKGQELLSDGKGEEVKGPINFVHQFVEMPKQKITIDLENGSKVEVTGCLPAMGYGFAAGTTDGPGEFNFAQGQVTENPFWNIVRDFVFPPTKEDMACQHPKPIIIAPGRINKPYQWLSEIVATQILQIGNVFIAAVPGEFTTMSGRRLRDTIKEAVISNGGPDNAQVVIAGLSNVYTNYIATFEEYQLQRYEGASTVFGPHSLSIYRNIYKNLAESLMINSSVEPGPDPKVFSDKLMSLNTPVLFDSSGVDHSFGDCILEPPSIVKIGETVTVKFISGHPRNDLMTEKSFLTVEMLNGDNWEVVATDACWETRFYWRRTDYLLATSEVEIQWAVTDKVKPGTYRIKHYGNYKPLLRSIDSYEGTTNTFEVQA